MFLSKIWRHWMSFLEIMGTVLMIVILSLTYFTMVAMIAVPRRMFTDSLKLRPGRRAVWAEREETVDFESMTKQG